MPDDRMPDERLAEIAQRVADARPSPWFSHGGAEPGEFDVHDGAGAMICWVADGHGLSEEHADFIAAARTDVPDLLAEVARSRREIAAKDREIDRLLVLLRASERSGQAEAEGLRAQLAAQAAQHAGEVARLREQVRVAGEQAAKWDVAAHGWWRRACVLAARFADLQTAALRVVNSAAGEPLTPGALDALRRIANEPLPASDSAATIRDAIAERDALRERIATVERQHVEALDGWARETDRVGALEAGLDKYGEHRSQCASYRVIDHTVPRSGYRPCDCGLTALLTPDTTTGETP